MRLPLLASTVTALLSIGAAQSVLAEQASEAEMARVCRNWLACLVHEQGAWAGSADPAVTEVHAIMAGDTLLARCYSIAPRGFVVVPALKELPPVITTSEETDLDPEEAGGMALFLRDVLRRRMRLFCAIYGDPGAIQPALGDVVFGRADRALWDRFLEDPGRFQADLSSGSVPPMIQERPLLRTAWHQGSPYQDLCPMGDGGRTVVGCVATALAQILRFHHWPDNGEGSYTNGWDGDQSCGGSTPGQDLTADFSDPYDWAHIPFHCEAGCSQQDQQAVAELCYEVGVACDLDYGYCGSSGDGQRIPETLVTHFRYQPTSDLEFRLDHTPESWFALIQTEIRGRRPMFYCNLTHAMVCDGWRTAGGENQIHINYGWGGSLTGWYAVDHIPGSYEPLFEYVIRAIIPEGQTVYRVRPDGAGPFPTIQSAIDVAAGDVVVELDDGIYRGEGNRDIDFHGKAIPVRSRSGDPASCILDCQGTPADPHRGFVFESGEGAASSLTGVTVTNGYSDWGGGGIYCLASPTISHCRFTSCGTDYIGGAFYSYGFRANPHITDCVFDRNQPYTLYCTSASSPTITGCTFANSWGAALVCFDSSPTISNCTFYGNWSTSAGGGVTCWGTSAPLIENTIIALSTSGCGVYCEDEAAPVLRCCNLYKNMAGDWDGCIASQYGTDGNICRDPLFVEGADVTVGYLLQPGSPCAPEYNPACGLIGAWPVDRTAAAAGEVPGAAPLALRIIPNPSSEACRILFRNPASGPVKVDLFDSGGRLVRRLCQAPFQAGECQLRWDGRDAAGTRLPSGLYFARVAAGEGRSSGRLVLIRSGTTGR